MSTRVRTRRAPVNAGQAPARVAGASRHRRVPYLLVGVLLVVGCAGGGVIVASQLGQRQTALVFSRPVSVGQELAAADLREVSIARDDDLAIVPARQRGEVVGRPVAYSLPAGSLLTKGVLGNPAVPPAGVAVAAVGLKAGQFPAGLQPGNRARVVAAPVTQESGDGEAREGEKTTSSWAATVAGVRAYPDDHLTVVTLQLTEADAEELAAEPEGALRVVIVNGDSR